MLAACAASNGDMPAAPSMQVSGSAASVVPMQADAFVDSIGVNTHLGFDLTRGANLSATIVKRMQQVGIRHIRDGIFPHQGARLNSLERSFFSATGADMLALTDCPKPLGYYPGSQTPPAVIRAFDRNVGGAVAQVEGPNEPDLRGVANWAPLTRTCIAGDDRALPVPFVASAMGYAPHAAELGNIASLIDVGAIHRYFSGHNPGTPGFWKHTACGEWEAMKTDICWARVNAGPTHPLWITETGYTTDGSLGSSEGEGQVDAATACKYIARVLFIDSIAGIVRSYLYELHDGGTDRSNPENGYGLLYYNGAPKPSFYAVRNVIALLTDPGPPFAPAPLDYSVSAPKTVTNEVFEKRDGSYVIAIWNEVPSWNWNTGKEIAVAPVRVTLRFAAAPAGVTYQVLDAGGNLVRQTANVSGTSVTVPVADSVGFLILTN